MHRVHHVHRGAAGVNGLLIAALTALTHADRPRHRRAVWRHRERQLPAALPLIAALTALTSRIAAVVSTSVASVRCHSHAPRASRAVLSRWREWAADCRPYGLDAHRSAAAPKGGLATSRAPAACCSVPLACTACITCRQRGAAGVNGLLIAVLTALTHADRPRHRRAAVPAMRCSASCSTRANGAAGCGAATLDLMQAAWL